MDKAGENMVYYSDTDSLFLKRKGMIKLSEYLDDEKLGYLAEEDKKIIKIRNVKDYDTDKERKIKGVKKGAKRIGYRRYEQIQFEKLLTGGRNERSERVVIKKVKKVMKKIRHKSQRSPSACISPTVWNGQMSSTSFITISIIFP